MALVVEYGFVNTDLLKKEVESALKVPVIKPKPKPIKRSFTEELLELGKGAILTTVSKWLEKEKQKVYKPRAELTKEEVLILKREEQRKKMIKYALIAGGIGATFLAIYLLRR